MKWQSRDDGGAYADEEAVLIKPDKCGWIVMWLDRAVRPRAYGTFYAAKKEAEFVEAQRRASDDAAI